MTENHRRVAALRAAAAADPANLGLRLDLARALLDAGDAAAALTECQAVLAVEPDRVEALEYAATAAWGCGDGVLAARYGRLRQTLANTSETERLPMLADPVPAAGRVDDGEDAGVTLADVGGMDEVKRKLRLSFLGPLQNPELSRMYRASLRGGLLLWGPPGCGKTFIARALAGELDAKFLAVGPHEVLDMYIGQSERNLHEVFEHARREAPVVLFLDELDALGRRRTQLRHSGGRDTVAQLLAELDGVHAVNAGVFVLAATNHPWDVDPALRRPGRFDRSLLVLPPDRPARAGILALNLRDRPLGDDVDVDAVAARTEHFSGADLAHLCQSAAELALEDSIARGVARPIVARDFQRALAEVRPSIAPWLQTARSYAQFANDGGAYDDLLAYLRAQPLS